MHSDETSDLYSNDRGLQKSCLWISNGRASLLAIQIISDFVLNPWTVIMNATIIYIVKQK